METLIRVHQAGIFRYLRFLGVYDRAVADDLAQETFLAAWRTGITSDDPVKQAAWLRGVARNLFLAHCRKQRRQPRALDAATLEKAELIWASNFLRDGDGFDYVEALRRCMERLSERQRLFLDLRYTQDKSREEMAQTLQMTEDGIKSALQRLRAILADCIAVRLKAEV